MFSILVGVAVVVVVFCVVVVLSCDVMVVWFRVDFY